MLRYLTYMHSVKDVFSEIEVCEIGIVGEFFFILEILKFGIYKMFRVKFGNVKATTNPPKGRKQPKATNTAIMSRIRKRALSGT